MPHAYLFSGPPGAPLVDDRARARDGAELPARARRWLRCERMCDACAKIAAGIHPDVVTLVREGAAQIVPIESVRNQVIARDRACRRTRRAIRVFIVEEATAMAPPAANALLKTLEEPPARTLFVLCTTAPEQLLPTIRSRCQRVRFAARHRARPAMPIRRAPSAIAALGDELAGDDHEPSLPVADRRGQGRRRAGAGRRRARAARARPRGRRGGDDRARAARRRARAGDPVVAHRGRDPQREPAARDRGADRAARASCPRSAHHEPDRRRRRRRGDGPDDGAADDARRPDERPTAARRRGGDGGEPTRRRRGRRAAPPARRRAARRRRRRRRRRCGDAGGRAAAGA